MTANILSRAVLYEVSLSCWGTERKVDMAKVNITSKGLDAVDPGKDALRLTKRLIKCEELDKIRQIDGKIRKYVYDRTVPSMRRKGVYFVNINTVPEIDSRMEEFKVEREDAVDAFCAVYEQHKTESKTTLGTLYNEGDYPTLQEVRDSFSFTTGFQAAGVAENLKDAYPELFKREQEKAEKAWAEASEEIRQVLREGLKNVIDHMVDRLQGNGDGKPKVFRDSLVTNMEEFLTYFDPRNITDDAQLSALVKKCKDTMSGVTAAKLRDTPTLRKSVIGSMATVKAEIDKLVVDKPGRKTLAA